MGDGLVYFFDVKSAFGSANRARGFQDLFAKFPSEKYLKKVQKCQNNLKMNIDLGFMSIPNIDYKRGWPECSCLGAYFQVIMKNSVIHYVKRHIPNANLVLYSDDIACVAKDINELREIHKRLTEGLA